MTITKFIITGCISPSTSIQEPWEVCGGAEEACVAFISITPSGDGYPLELPSLQALPTLHPGDIHFSSQTEPDLQTESVLICMERVCLHLLMENAACLWCSMFPWKARKVHHLCDDPEKGRGGQALCRSPWLCLTISNDYP